MNMTPEQEEKLAEASRRVSAAIGHSVDLRAELESVDYWAGLKREREELTAKTDDTDRNEINRKLAQAIGYDVQIVGDQESSPFYQLVNAPHIDQKYHRWRDSHEKAWADGPDFFTDAAASRMLVAWIGAQDYYMQKRFGEKVATAIIIPDTDGTLLSWVEQGSFEPADIADILTASLETIALAAAAAIDPATTTTG